MKDFLQLDKSPLHQATATGDTAMLSSLLAAGEDINARIDAAEGWGIFYLGVTPLMVAACSPLGATDDTLHWLIEHGAGDKTPPMLAALSGSLKILQEY
ncbi:MAG: ankyrin repeat domain-containing protein [Leptolyngbya sp. SIO3F4]|nr:ankyrin repeat domain-containing protein [Leptolyngbya sp. SIO3F4]